MYVFNFYITLLGTDVNFAIVEQAPVSVSIGHMFLTTPKVPHNF